MDKKESKLKSIVLEFPVFNVPHEFLVVVEIGEFNNILVAEHRDSGSSIKWNNELMGIVCLELEKKGVSNAQA